MADVYPEGVPPDIMPLDHLIERLGDEAEERGEKLLDSAEERARRMLMQGLAASFIVWLLLRK